MMTVFQSILPYAWVLVKCVAAVLLIFVIPMGLGYLVWRFWRRWDQGRR